MIFNEESIVNMCDLKIFLDTDDDVRLSRRIFFDVHCRKKDLDESIDRYLKYIKPSFDKYV